MTNNYCFEINISRWAIDRNSLGFITELCTEAWMPPYMGRLPYSTWCNLGFKGSFCWKLQYVDRGYRVGFNTCRIQLHNTYIHTLIFSLKLYRDSYTFCYDMIHSKIDPQNVMARRNCIWKYSTSEGGCYSISLMVKVDSALHAFCTCSQSAGFSMRFLHHATQSGGQTL